MPFISQIRKKIPPLMNFWKIVLTLEKYLENSSSLLRSLKKPTTRLKLKKYFFFKSATLINFGNTYIKNTSLYGPQTTYLHKNLILQQQNTRVFWANIPTLSKKVFYVIKTNRWLIFKRLQKIFVRLLSAHKRSEKSRKVKRKLCLYPPPFRK